VIGLASLSGGLAAARLESPSRRGPSASTAPPADPRRVVALSLAPDAIVLARLGPGRIAALASFADDPSVSYAAEAAVAVRRRATGRSEAILTLSPDLVLTGSFGDPGLLELLATAGVPVLRLSAPSSIEEVYQNVRDVGRAVGQIDRAELLISDAARRIAAVRGRVENAPRKRVLVLQRSNYTAGRGTVVDDLLTAVGVSNAVAEEGLRGHLPLSVEQILRIDPDVVLYSGFVADGRARALGLEGPMTGHPSLRHLRAHRAGQVFEVPARTLMTTSHHVADAVEDLARRLHGAGR
jgi:iron complex transport system substrate-binding protein